LDIYAGEGLLTSGGNALNVAAHWALAGREVQFFGAVGDDPNGDRLTEMLAALPLDLSSMVRLPGFATAVTEMGIRGGERVVVHEDYEIVKAFHSDRRMPSKLARASWVHVAGDEALIERVRAVTGEIPVSYDFSTHHTTVGLEGLALGCYSWPDSTLEQARRLAQSAVQGGCRAALVMRGPVGSLYFDGTTLFECPARQIEAVDTCGAGDSFIAEFVLAHLAGESPSLGLSRATQAASNTCRYLGGWPQQPHRYLHAVETEDR
jgi:fructoselysine 6-kinase